MHNGEKMSKAKMKQQERKQGKSELPIQHQKLKLIQAGFI